MLKKEYKRIGFAVKEYYDNYIEPKNNKNPAYTKKSVESIEKILSRRNRDKEFKGMLFNSEIISQFKGSIAKSSLFLSSMGKKKLWKPARFVPPKTVFSQNIVEG